MHMWKSELLYLFSCCITFEELILASVKHRVSHIVPNKCFQKFLEWDGPQVHAGQKKFFFLSSTRNMHLFICSFKGVKCFPIKVFLFIEKEAKIKPHF